VAKTLGRFLISFNWGTKMSIRNFRLDDQVWSDFKAACAANRATASGELKRMVGMYLQGSIPGSIPAPESPEICGEEPDATPELSQLSQSIAELKKTIKFQSDRRPKSKRLGKSPARMP